MRSWRQTGRGMAWAQRVAMSGSALLGLLLVTLGMAAEGRAVTLSPGDIIVADPNALGGSGGIIRVNPLTGVQTTISSGGELCGSGWRGRGTGTRPRAGHPLADRVRVVGAGGIRAPIQEIPFVTERR